MTTVQTYRLETRIDNTLTHSVCASYADVSDALAWFDAEALSHPLRYSPDRHARLVLLAVGNVVEEMTR